MVHNSPDVVPVEGVAVVDANAVALRRASMLDFAREETRRSAHPRLEMAAVGAAAGRAVDEVLRVGGVGDERLELGGVLGGGEAAEEGEDDGGGEAHLVKS